MRQLGYFFLLNELGQGQFGPAYRAWDLRGARTVTLKTLRLTDLPGVIDPGALRQKLVQDFRRVTTLVHPRIAQTYGLERDGDLDFLVTESVNGPSLEQLMLQDDVIDLALGLRIWQQTAEAIDAAHSRSVMHGSVWPQAVLLDAEGNIKLADFGLNEMLWSKPLSGDAPVAVPHLYAAPERLVGTATTGRADQYSLAVVIYEMITGQRPFSASTVAELEAKIGRQDYPSVSVLKPMAPPGVDGVLGRALSRDPQSRFGSAGELFAALKSVLDGGAPPPAPRRQAPAPMPVPVAAPPEDLRTDIYPSPAPVMAAAAMAPVIAEAPMPPARRGEARLNFNPLDEREPASKSPFLMLMLLLIVVVAGLVWYLNRGNSVEGAYMAGAVLSGHENSVLSAAFNPDGKTVASASLDHTVRFWDLASKQSVKSLNASDLDLTSLAFSPDGGLLAGGTNKEAVRLWDVAQGTVFRNLASKQQITSQVAFSPDGELIAVGTNKGEIELWNASTGKAGRSWKAHADSVFALSFRGDGKVLASGGGDKLVKLWNVEDGSQKSEFEGHTASVDALSWGPSGERLASGSFDGGVKVWNLATGKVERDFTGQTKPVYAVAYRPDGNVIASGGGENTIKIWTLNAPPNARPETLTGHTGPITSLQFGKDGKTLASSSEDHTVRLWTARP